MYLYAEIVLVLLSRSLQNEVHSPSLGSKRSTVGFCFRSSLEQVDVGFGVGEFLEPLDLQISVFVGDETYDVNRLAIRIHPG